MFYQKTQKLLDLALWMQNAENGISIADIMQKFKVSKRTAIRMKDMVKEQFPQIKEISGAHNTKRWYIPPCSLGQYVGFSLSEINALQKAATDEILHIGFTILAVFLFGLFWLSSEQDTLRANDSCLAFIIQRSNNMLQESKVTIAIGRNTIN